MDVPRIRSWEGERFPCGEYESRISCAKPLHIPTVPWWAKYYSAWHPLGWVVSMFLRRRRKAWWKASLDRGECPPGGPLPTLEEFKAAVVESTRQYRDFRDERS